MLSHEENWIHFKWFKLKDSKTSLLFIGKEISKRLWGNQRLEIAKSKLSQSWVDIGKNYDYWRWLRATGLEKVGFIFIPQKGNGKEYSNYCTIALLSHINFPGGSVSIVSAFNAGFNPWVERSPGEGNGNPFQYSCLENPTDRGTW